MNVTHPPDLSGEHATSPRVRHQAREALLLMGFSLAVSVTCALLLLVLHLAPGAGR